MAPRNRLRRIAIGWAVLAVLGAGVAALPFIVGAVRVTAIQVVAFGIVTIGGIAALLAGTRAVLFRAQAEVLERLLTESDLLAHWTYAQQDVKEEIEKAVHADARASWKHLAWISLCALGVGLLAMLRVSARHRFKDVFFYLGASGVVALLAPAVVLLDQRAGLARRRRAAPEAFVSREAAYVFGELHTWRLQRARVKTALVTEESKPSLRVEYLLPWPARIGKGRPDYFRTVLIPVPPGEEERARSAALAIMGSTSSEQPARTEG